MQYGPLKQTKKTFLEYLGLGLLHIAIFAFFYGMTNNRAASLPFEELYIGYHPLELEIPFFPNWFIVYYSVNVMLWVPYFFIPPYRFRRYFLAQIMATVTASFFFYHFPFHCGYVREIPTAGPWKDILTFFYALDESHNLIPSLHIGFSTMILLFSREGAGKRWYVILHIWTFAIYASVVLTHQHHIMDIVTGIALSCTMYKLANHLCDGLGPYFQMPQEQKLPETPL